MQKEEIPHDIQEIIDMQLVHHENVLWVGVPDPMALLKRRVMSSFPGALIFIVVLVVIFFAFTQMNSMFNQMPSGMFGGRGASPAGFFSLFRIAFLGILAFIVLKPVWNYLKQIRSVYVVTNQRVFTIVRAFTTDIQSYGPQHIEFVKVRYYGGDYGDVIFDREMHSYRDYDQPWGSRTRTHVVEIGFFGVQDPNKVEALLLENFVNQSDEQKAKRKNSHWD